MVPRSFLTVGAAFVLGGLQILAPGICPAVTLYLPGSTATILATVPGSPFGDIEIDAAGNLYLAAGSAGVLKVSRQGAVSTWSNAAVSDLAFAPDGTGYGAGRSLCNCIYQIGPDGTGTTLRQDTHEWDWVAVTPDGALYADVIAGAGQGFYRIDRTTGGVSPIVIGGPGPGGNGLFGHLGIGVDGKLYVNGSPDGGTPVVYRLDGTTLTPVNIPPYGYGVIGAGPRGLDIVGVTHNTIGELWLFNPVTGASNLLAQAEITPHGPAPIFNAFAYDPGADLIYATQGGTIWAIHADLSTPAQSATWGAVKARYHR